MKTFNEIISEDKKPNDPYRLVILAERPKKQKESSIVKITRRKRCSNKIQKTNGLAFSVNLKQSEIQENKIVFVL